MPMTSEETARSLTDSVRPTLNAWNLKADKIELISISENIVFKLDADDGNRYSLRLHRPEYHTLQELESEQLWTDHLRDHGLAVPKAHVASHGGHYTEVHLPVLGESRRVGLIDWIEGNILSDVSRDWDNDAKLAVVVECGSVMAQIHNASAAWQPPSEFTRHSFDADGFVGRRLSGDHSGTCRTSRKATEIC